MILKGYKIEDTGTKVITFPQTTTVKNIKTGILSEAKGDVSVDNFSDLVKLNSKTRIKHIVHKESGETLSEVAYLEREKELLEKRAYDEDEYEHRWKSLDDEFNYRKFIASYNKESETYFEEEEIVVQEIKSVLLDTKHPFIHSKFQSLGEVSDICVYNKPSAYLTILAEKMKEIGAEWLDGSGFGDKTAGKLAWSNSTHSNIRYARLSGDYLFNDSYEAKHSPVGTFEKLEAEYNADRERIRKIIHDKYVLKFGKFNEEKTPSVLEAIQKLEIALSCTSKLIPTKKSYSDKSSVLKFIREAKELLNNSFSVE